MSGDTWHQVPHFCPTCFRFQGMRPDDAHSISCDACVEAKRKLGPDGWKAFEEIGEPVRRLMRQVVHSTSVYETIRDEDARVRGETLRCLVEIAARLPEPKEGG